MSSMRFAVIDADELEIGNRVNIKGASEDDPIFGTITKLEPEDHPPEQLNYKIKVTIGRGGSAISWDLISTDKVKIAL